jgi:hypothetical protein
MKNVGMMLTQYERYGSVGMDEYIQYYIDEELEIDISMLGEYNEYLRNRCYETFFTFEELEEDLQYMKPDEAFRLGKFSSFTYADDYLQYDGYGNIKGFSEYEVLEGMEKDKDFLKWYVENYIDIDEDEANEAIEEANKLIQEGY